MYWILGSDRTVHGPFPPEQVRQWLAEGRLTAQSLVQRDGSGAWVTIAACPELRGAAPRPGAPGALPSIGHVLIREYDLAVGACLERGFKLYQAHFGLLLAVGLLYLVLPYVAQVPSFVGQVILGQGGEHPGALAAGLLLVLLGLAASLAVTAPLFGALPWPALRLLRGEPAQVGDLLVGFRRGLVPLVGWLVVVVLALLGCLLPTAALVGGGAYLHHVGRAPAGTACLVLAIPVTVAALAWWTYLYVAWRFAPLLIVDRGLDLRAALRVSKRKVAEDWWSVFGLLLVSSLVGGAGFALCCIGLVFSLPLQPAIQACAYERIFGYGRF